MTTSQTAEYKGRKYRLAFCGETKFGRRAKLAFFDGSKEFWVAADAIQIIEGSAARSTSTRARSFRSGAYDSGCWGCRDARAAGKEACKQCMFDEYDC